MHRIRLRNRVFMSLLALLWLAACSSQPPAPGVTPSLQFSATPAPTEIPAYPDPGAVYPLPGSQPQSTDPASEMGPGAYPGPATSGSQTLPTAPPTPNPYLAAGEEQPAPPGNPYPAPEGAQPAGALPSPTNPPLQPTQALRTELQTTNPDEVELASGQVQLIEFYADWCGDCRAMAPVMHDLQDRYASRVNFVFLDIQDPQTQSLQDRLGYEFPPHFFLLAGDGEVLNEWIGFVPETEISAHIEVALR
jgi:thiol-disulfide isomerase/thioredoxin